MHHLPDGPSASAIRRIELGFLQTVNSLPDFGGQRLNLIHGLLPPRRSDLGGHLEISNRVTRIHREHLLEQRLFRNIPTRIRTVNANPVAGFSKLEISRCPP